MDWSDADRFVVTVHIAFFLEQPISEIRGLSFPEWVACALIAKSIRDSRSS